MQGQDRTVKQLKGKELKDKSLEEWFKKRQQSDFRDLKRTTLPGTMPLKASSRAMYIQSSLSDQQ